jgi:hypothetical protein
MWSLVIVALVGAITVRPIELSPRSPDESSKLAAPHTGLPVHAGRRARAHDLPVATLPLAPSLDRPRTFAVVALRAAHAAPAAICVSSRSSRGPPIG